jgi:ribosome-binding protein aMBF1 (putative translation factor)
MAWRYSDARAEDGVMNENNFMDEVLKSLDDTPTVEEVTPSLKKAAERLKNNPKHSADLLKAQFVALIQQAMDEEGVSKSMLAERVHKSRQYIGRVLNETANFTIESMVELCFALNLKLEIDVKKVVPAYQEDCSHSAEHSSVKILSSGKRIVDVA